MKRWNKTVMKWDCHLGLETNVPVTDWYEKDKKYVHTVCGIKITSMHDRTGYIEILINRVSIGPTTEREKIINLLSVKVGNLMIYRAQEGMLHSSQFTIDFKLDDGDQFCDTAIKIVRAIFQALGVEDIKGYRLADFSIKQDTFMQLDGVWITFVNWLRIQHRLPVFSTEPTA